MPFHFEDEALARSWELHDECLAILEDALPLLQEHDEELCLRGERALARPLVRICYVRQILAGHLDWKSNHERNLALNLSIHNAVIRVQKALEEVGVRAEIRLDANPVNWSRGGRLEGEHWWRQGYLAGSRSLRQDELGLALLEISNQIDIDLLRYQKKIRAARGEDLGSMGDFFL